VNGDFLLKVLVPNIIPDNEVDRGKLREIAWHLLVRHYETILALALELTRVREMDKNPHVNSNSSVDPDIGAQGRLYQSPRFDPLQPALRIAHLAPRKRCPDAVTELIDFGAPKGQTNTIGDYNSASC
jgi:hypothetical protein